MMKSLIFLLAVVSIGPATAHPDPAHSLAELDRHLAEAPDDATLHLRRAELLIRRNHPDTARPSVARALSLAPDNPEILLLPVRLAHVEKDLPQALAHVQKLTLRFPLFPPGWKWLARLQKESGNESEAIIAKLHHLSFRTAVDPGDFLSAATWLRERNLPEDPLLALSTLDQAVAIFGPMISLQQVAVSLEMSLAHFDQALTRVAALVEKYGPSAAFSLLRADIYEAAGRYSEAASACDSAIALLEMEPTSGTDPLTAIRDQVRTRKAENLSKVKQ